MYNAISSYVDANGRIVLNWLLEQAWLFTTWHLLMSVRCRQLLLHEEPTKNGCVPIYYRGWKIYRYKLLSDDNIINKRPISRSISALIHQCVEKWLCWDKPSFTFGSPFLYDEGDSKQRDFILCLHYYNLKKDLWKVICAIDQIRLFIWKFGKCSMSHHTWKSRLRGHLSTWQLNANRIDSASVLGLYTTIAHTNSAVLWEEVHYRKRC